MVSLRVTKNGSGADAKNGTAPKSMTPDGLRSMSGPPPWPTTEHTTFGCAVSVESPLTLPESAPSFVGLNSTRVVAVPGTSVSPPFCITRCAAGTVTIAPTGAKSFTEDVSAVTVTSCNA
jgi:hypothetical protein